MTNITRAKFINIATANFILMNSVYKTVEITNLVYLAGSNNDVSSSVNSVRTRLYKLDDRNSWLPLKNCFLNYSNYSAFS